MSPPQHRQISSLDFIRGLLLCVIITDHLFRFPNIFELVTGRGQLWVSAAEGFFLISGLLVGVVYRTKIYSSTRQVFQKLWRRAISLYLTSIILTLFFTYVGQFIPSEFLKPGLWHESVTSLIINTLTLKYTYGWADFLNYYSVFMFFAPFGLLLVSRKKTWGLLLLSSLIWLNRGSSFYLSWQILFFLSLTLGFHLNQLVSRFSLLKTTTKKFLVGFCAGTTITSLIFSVLSVFVVKFPLVQTTFIDLNNHLQIVFDKNTLGPGRVILSLFWFTSVILLINHFEIKIPSSVYRLFASMGKNSLFVYCLHALILFPINYFLPKETNYFQNTLITSGVIASVLLITLFKKEVSGWLSLTLTHEVKKKAFKVNRSVTVSPTYVNEIDGSDI